MAAYDHLIEELIAFGLTRQEATIYITLLTEGELTGYEVAKSTGISRSNTYSALAGLVDKGASYSVTEGTTTRYTPVDLKEFSGNYLEKLKQIQKQMLKNPPKLKEKSEGYITIAGMEHSIDKIRNMILSAEKRIYFVAAAEVIAQFHVELGLRIKKGVKVVLLTNVSELGTDKQLKGSIVYPIENMHGQMRLIVDSTDVLTGNLSDENCDCLYSRNPNLIDVFKEMMRSEIVLLEQKYETKETVLVAMPKEI